ncbi:ABC transporter permease [Emticicia sp. SJ17W-69]|uniref:ABC transporter permease n=1 Tax=Emticicia sp. SJ17W-69 TaxID=3421657 RepID=UPI003EBC1C48
MLKNYLKIAFRNLWKNKLFSFINIMGLGLAIPFALLSLMQLESSFEFDNFHPNSDRIYRIITDEKSNEGGTVSYASSPYLLADNLKNNYVCVEKATKVVRDFGWELNNRIKTIRVNTIYVEPTFFDVFGFSLANGSLPTEPNSLVLSHEMAENFFNEVNPVGKILTHPTYGSFKITGVLKPFKKQTQFRSDVMVSMATYVNINKEATQPQSWGDYKTHTFVKLRANAQPNSLDLALNEIASKSNENIVSAKKTNQFRKQALKDISPSLEKLRFNPYVEDLADISFNFAIPIMILLLAGFNYTNLTLARSLSRSREVGVRKVMGAVRRQLIFQFICEAVVIAVFALFIGVTILFLMKQTIHVQWVTWDVENQGIIWLIFLAFTLLLGILAGALPAWILSGFQPVSVLKGTLSPASFGKISFRKSLVVIQFVVTMSFIFFIVHMYSQFDYMATENDNFNRKGIFNITLVDKNYALLIDEIEKNKNVEKVGLTSNPFGGMTAEFAVKAQKTDKNEAAYYYAADRNFIENMNLKFLAGQNLPLSKSDSATNFVVINQKAVERLHLGTIKEAIGKSIILNNATEAQVVGVVQNFCHFNYQFEIQPLVFQYNPAQFQVLSVQTTEKISQDDFLAEMKTLWKAKYPYQTIVYSWYEKDMYDRYYPAEDMKMMGMASMVIFVIAIMGLLGMVTYSTEKRIKEIGIRKVMGASIWEIVKILSWSFMKLLLIAGIIALPIGYVSGLFLLSIFTFHTSINIELMSLFFCLVFMIAILTISYQVIKTAMMNPVRSLRSE